MTQKDLDPVFTKLDTVIDRVLQRTLRKIEAERRQRADLGLDPEAGTTPTEAVLAAAMRGEASLEELADAVD